MKGIEFQAEKKQTKNFSILRYSSNLVVLFNQLQERWLKQQQQKQTHLNV